MDFEWHPQKANKNLTKHGVEFSEAVTVFGDPFELTIADPSHSIDEFRFLSLGRSGNGRPLLVSYTEREPRTVRIISARPANKREQQHYEARHPKR